ncbi:MAG: long-chain acyl-CoA synthetase, partial [Streblomastix strix]
QFCAQFEQGDYTPLLPRIPEDDHNYFIETYDPTNPDTYKNGLDQPPDRKQQFIQFTTFNGKTSKQLEQEELQEINEPEVGDGDQNNTEKQKLNSFHKQKFNFRVYSWNYLRSFGEKIRKIESNDKLKQQEEEQEQQDYLKQDEQQQQPNQPFSLQPYTECINHWKSLSNPVIPTQDSILTIIFTSGTTGTPKGVILKHRNLISTIQAGLSFGMNIFHEDSSYYAYLPLAHVFEFIIEFAVMTIGGKIGYSSGDTKEIINEVAVLKPELFVGVPRVLNKIYEAFQNAIQQVAQKSRIMKFVFNSALKRKLKIQEECERINLIDAGTKPRTPLYDKYVFNKFAEKLGGNIYFIMCGSAPLSPQVHKFLQ